MEYQPYIINFNKLCFLKKKIKKIRVWQASLGMTVLEGLEQELLCRLARTKSWNGRMDAGPSPKILMGDWSGRGSFRTVEVSKSWTVQCFRTSPTCSWQPAVQEPFLLLAVSQSMVGPFSSSLGLLCRVHVYFPGNWKSSLCLASP